MQALYEQYKGLLFTLSYQLTGSASDAEDVVQDVFLKAHDLDWERLKEPKAYLCRMATNRCRDLLKSARRRREQYVGEWLPEPVHTPKEDTALELVVQNDLLSYAMLVMLERLSPAERAVFVLREGLGLEYAELAEILEKSEVNCRKVFSRAKGKMGLVGEGALHREAESEYWVRKLLSALGNGQVNEVVALLAEDVTLISDGGGKVLAAVRPIRTRASVVSFLFGLANKAPRDGNPVHIDIRSINGQTGVILRSDEGIDTAVLLHVEGDAIRSIYLVRNPDKLKHLS